MFPLSLQLAVFHHGSVEFVMGHIVCCKDTSNLHDEVAHGAQVIRPELDRSKRRVCPVNGTSKLYVSRQRAGHWEPRPIEKAHVVFLGGI
jgi:hypothetical protein